MARLLTSGFETGNILSEPPCVGGPSTQQPTLKTGIPVATQAVARGGSWSAKIDCSVTGGQRIQWGMKSTGLDDGVSYFQRVWVNFEAFPNNSSDRTVFGQVGAYFARINNSGTLALQYVDTTVIGSRSEVLELDTWHCIELKQEWQAAGVETAELRLDGVSVASESTERTAVTIGVNFEIGSAVDSDMVFYADDIAINNDVGADQNSWPGVNGKVVLLKPTADSAVGSGWQQPSSGTDVTNVWQSVSNVPPLGVEHSDVGDNNLNYAFNPDASATDLDVVMQTYTVGGLVSADTVTLVQALASVGSDNATDTAGAIEIVSNPAVVEETFSQYDAYNIVAGTFPTGWRTWRSPPAYSPTVVKATAPVLRIGKDTAVARTVMVDLLGILVEYASDNFSVVPVKIKIDGVFV